MRTSRARPAIALLLAVSLALPAATVRAQAERPAMDYEACMNAAEDDLRECLKWADDAEELCWSRYGYTKIYCTGRYIIASIFRRKS